MRLPLRSNAPLTMATVTYTLGRSLYVPLTSRCNSLTLPQTRGPNFMLPSEVVSSLLRVRQMEDPSLDDNSSLLDSTPASSQRMRLPTPPFPRIRRLDDSSDFDNDHGALNDGRQPSVRFLTQEILQVVKQETFSFDEIVIAGEGEPTLRLSALLCLARCLSSNSSGPTCSIPLRLITNGLLDLPDPTVAVKQLADAGIQTVTVALMTSSASQYNQLMEPSSMGEKSSPHDVVCNFVKSCGEVGLQVQVTGVDGGPIQVDKTKAEDLAVRLGVTTPFRWRPYFA